MSIKLYRHVLIILFNHHQQQVFGFKADDKTCYHQRSRHCRHSRLSSVHWRRNCFADRMTTHTSGNSSIDTSLIRDIYLRPWSFVSDLCHHEIRGWWWWWWRNVLCTLIKAHCCLTFCSSRATGECGARPYSQQQH